MPPVKTFGERIADALREDGLLSEADFSDFTFGNPVRLFTGMNPEFFHGTAVENQVATLLAES